MAGPAATLLSEGERLHLQHGPIDLIISAETQAPEVKFLAYKAAAKRFETLLEEIVSELPLLRSPSRQGSPEPAGPVARRMCDSVRPHSASNFVTPMAAVAGSVADEILEAMKRAVPLRKAIVNNGGDIAFHLSLGEAYRIGMFTENGRRLGEIKVDGESGVGGVATSGLGGKSFSFGIADSVTVLARTAAEADAAATLIGNQITLENHPAVMRCPANKIDPDTDLGEHLVVMHCGPLSKEDIESAITRGVGAAREMAKEGLMNVAALFLQEASRLVGRPEYFESELTVEAANS